MEKVSLCCRDLNKKSLFANKLTEVIRAYDICTSLSDLKCASCPYLAQHFMGESCKEYLQTRVLFCLNEFRRTLMEDGTVDQKPLYRRHIFTFGEGEKGKRAHDNGN